jgi:hypothetical protein
MLSRRELVTGGMIGSLASPASGASTAEVQDADREGHRAIERAIQSGASSIRNILEGPTLSYGPVPALRKLMEQFLRTNQRFPEYIDIGPGVFYDVYDWHVRNQQPIVITRQVDNRYTIQFMMTQLILRHDVESNFIGYAYDKA